MGYRNDNKDDYRRVSDDKKCWNNAVRTPVPQKSWKRKRTKEKGGEDARTSGFGLGWLLAFGLGFWLVVPAAAAQLQAPSGPRGALPWEQLLESNHESLSGSHSLKLWGMLSSLLGRQTWVHAMSWLASFACFVDCDAWWNCGLGAVKAWFWPIRVPYKCRFVKGHRVKCARRHWRRRLRERIQAPIKKH